MDRHQDLTDQDKKALMFMLNERNTANMAEIRESVADAQFDVIRLIRLGFIRVKPLRISGIDRAAFPGAYELTEQGIEAAK
jgi:hypothetical protein